MKSLIFRINNLEGNFRQIFEFKRLTGKVFKNQRISGGWSLGGEIHPNLSETRPLYILIITISKQATGHVCGVYFPSKRIELRGKLRKQGLDKFSYTAKGNKRVGAHVCQSLYA
jgi:hypothetical protein